MAMMHIPDLQEHTEIADLLIRSIKENNLPGK
jgi:hypothetical protein